MHFHCRITSGQGRLNNSTDCKIIGRSPITGNNTKVIYVFGCVFPDSLTLGKSIFTLITSSKAQQPPAALKAGPTGGQAVTRFKQWGLALLISAAKPAPCSHGSGFPQEEGICIQIHIPENSAVHGTGVTPLLQPLLVPPAAGTPLTTRDLGLLLPGRKELVGAWFGLSLQCQGLAICLVFILLVDFQSQC